MPITSCAEIDFPEERPFRVTNLKTQERITQWAETRSQARVRAAVMWQINPEEVR